MEKESVGVWRMRAADTLAFMGLEMVHASVTVSIFVFQR